VNKTCPKCNAGNDERELVCDCGHLFLEDLDAQGSEELLTIRSHARRGKLKKFAIIAGTGIVSVGVLLYWVGWADGSPKNPLTDQPAPTAAAPATPAPNLISPPPSSDPSRNSAFIVTSVLTGDMISVLSSDNQQHSVRIFGIVSPKLDENFGKESRDYLSRQILGKTVSLISKRTANDGVLFAEVLKDGINIGVEQIRSGLARVASDEALQKDPVALQLYSGAEFIAKSGRFGVWTDGTIVNVPADPGDENSVASTVPYRSTERTVRFRPSGSRIPDPQSGSTGAETGELPNVLETKPAPEPSEPPEAPKAVTRTEIPSSVKQRDERAVSQPDPVRKLDSPSRAYTRGPRGGCFYLSPGGNKVYVDRSLCS
jgi:endonuclease YncB( thermonuclease family)